MDSFSLPDILHAGRVFHQLLRHLDAQLAGKQSGRQGVTQGRERSALDNGRLEKEKEKTKKGTFITPKG
jgi:hypothetical protein